MKCYNLKLKSKFFDYLVFNQSKIWWNCLFKFQKHFFWIIKNSQPCGSDHFVASPFLISIRLMIMWQKIGFSWFHYSFSAQPISTLFLQNKMKLSAGSTYSHACTDSTFKPYTEKAKFAAATITTWSTWPSDTGWTNHPHVTISAGFKHINLMHLRYLNLFFIQLP